MSSIGLTKLIQKLHVKYLNAPWDLGKSTSQQFIDRLDAWDTFNIGGVDFLLNSKNYIDRYLLRYKCFDPVLEAVLACQELPGTFLDVGANFGYFSLLAAKHGKQTLSVEPSPRELARLYRHLTINPALAPLVQVFPFAIGAKSEDLPFSLSGDSNTGQNHLGATMVSEDSQTISVKVRTLNDLIPQIQIDEVDVIKIDVEGYEGVVLESMGPLLEKNTNMALYIEFTPSYITERTGMSTDSLTDLVLKSGFRSVSRRGSKNQWDELFIKGNIQALDLPKAHFEGE